MEAGRFGEGKKNIPKKYGRRKDAAAPPVGRRSPFSVARPKLVLDSGGLLMEATTAREWSSLVRSGFAYRAYLHRMSQLVLAPFGNVHHYSGAGREVGELRFLVVLGKFRFVV